MMSLLANDAFFKQIQLGERSDFGVSVYFVRSKAFPSFLIPFNNN